MITSTDDFISFLQTKKPSQNKDNSNNPLKKKVSFSKSVTFHEKGNESGQSSVYDGTNSVNSNQVLPLWNHDTNPVLNINHENSNEKNTRTVNSKQNLKENEDGWATRNSSSVTESQSDIVPSFKRSLSRTKALDGSLGDIDNLFGNNMNSNRAFDDAQESYFTQSVVEDSFQSKDDSIIDDLSKLNIKPPTT